MRNAQLILEEVKREWRSVDEIVRSAAAKFDCGVEDVREGVEAVVGELAGQRFVEVEATGETPVVPVGSMQRTRTSVVPVNGQDARSPSEDDDWSPLGDFFMRHGLPSELHIDLTDGCNERCVHCYLSRGGAHFIEKDVAFKVLQEYREAQGLTVYISGGECMLHKDFAEILRYAKSLDLNIVVLSNLTLCDGNTIELRPLNGSWRQFQAA